MTIIGMVNFSVNCRGLKEFYCDSGNFGVKGMNAVLDHCPFLENLIVEHLNRLVLKDSAIRPGVAAYSLKTICIKYLINGYQFRPLILSSKNLGTLKIVYCSGDWDKVFEAMTPTNLFEIHLETLPRISDIALIAISKNCLNLEILHLLENANYMDLGLVYIANHCNLLREVHHIVRWNISDEIGDEGVTTIAERCPNLEELILIGI
ncbi:F-box protein SKIP2-like [Macadamia integrifolia]|uniref:F-box protein SKIP2-like n=1 Tax=Macadamia integrifolia TaxID=60698 RepID=UPI001C4F0EC4|nr:F-box protein SKIP2-like [Macadamia integrifolia]